MFGDSLAYIRTLADNSYDLAFIDPPFEMGADNRPFCDTKVKQSNGSVSLVKQGFGKGKWDKAPTAEFFDEVLRVSKHQIIMGVNHFDYLFPSKGRLVWDKLNGINDQYGCEIIYLSMTERTDIVYYLWSGMMQGLTVSQDIKVAIRQQGNKKLNEKRIHHTQKPVKLYEWILEKYAPGGCSIIDTGIGSGSLAIACYNKSYNLLGFENDAGNFSKLKSRVTSHVENDKGSLFPSKNELILE